MRKITDEGFLFLYGAGLLVTAETGMPAVITILFACIYTCVNLVGEEKYLHYIMTIAFVAAGIASKEMWMFLPVVLYNMLCFYSPVYIGAGGIIVACEAPAFREYYGLEKEMLIVAGLAAAVLLYGRTRRLNELEQEYKRVRDDSRELTLMLEKKNQDLLEKQDTEVYLATLKERNRIAREIHDNVGHMLSRSILMVGALKTVNQAENLKVPMDQLDQTLNEAMTNVRQSVHDLHDESVNLKEVMESLAEEFRFCPVQLTYHAGHGTLGVQGAIKNSCNVFFNQLTYDMGYDIPKEIKYSFIAITKEALNNVMRHSNANEVKILAREHPGLYQLIIEDNGTSDERIRPNGDREEYAEKESAGKTGNTRKTENTECSGIGIKNMKKRVRMLGGTIQIQKENGFRIFITVPKNEGKR